MLRLPPTSRSAERLFTRCVTISSVRIEIFVPVYESDRSTRGMSDFGIRNFQQPIHFSSTEIK